MTEDPIRGLLLFSPQTQADIGGAAVSQQQRDRIDQNGYRKSHIDRRHAGDLRAVAYKDLIDNVIEIIDHEGQRCRNGVAEQQFG